MDEQLKKEAYVKGLKLKNTGLDQETIAIRLEKQGIPHELAKKVARNVFLQRQIDAVNNRPAPGIYTLRWKMFSHLAEEIRLWFKLKKENKK